MPYTKIKISDFAKANFNKGGIYKIVNLINGKVYVGSTYEFRHRYNRHNSNLNRFKHSPKLRNSVNKYGFNAFEFRIIKVLQNTSEINLMAWEQKYIDKYDSYNMGYNCTPTAEGNKGHKHSEESKLKMSIAKLGKPASHSAKTFTLINPEGKQIKIFNLRNWCKDNNLNYVSIHKVIRGIRKSSHKYKAAA
jgi:group I intron endonuclease